MALNKLCGALPGAGGPGPAGAADILRSTPHSDSAILGAGGPGPAGAALAAAPGHRKDGNGFPCPPESRPNSAAALLAAAAAQQHLQDAGATDLHRGPAQAVSDWRSLKDVAAAAAAGLSTASLIDATARAAAGIGPEEDMVGAAAEECLRDGSANGIGWAWGFTAGGLVAYRFGLTRSGIMHDKYMDGFDGILVSDRYTVYRIRFEADGRLQICWAHELRDLAETAMRPGSTLAARMLHKDVRGVYRAARDAAASGTPRTKALRLMYEQYLDDVLAKYRKCGKEDAEKMVAMLDRDKQSLFTFLEHEGVEPTNNRAERALRYIVLLRKIFGQIKGGRRSMERWGHLATCVRTWRAQGKSIMEEIRRIM